MLLSTVATEAISTHSAAYLFIALVQFHTEILQLQWTTVEN